MPCMAAAAPARVVIQGTPCMRARRRIRYPSVRGPRPQGVLTIRSTPPASIRPSTSSPSSPILGTTMTGKPLFLSTSAVPSLAEISKPRSAKALAMSTTARFSLLATERSEEHTSELQSHSDLVCRLLLEKKKKHKKNINIKKKKNKKKT